MKCENGKCQYDIEGVKTACMNLAQSMNAFAPRLLVTVCGVPISAAESACEYLVSNGLLQRVQRDGETWYSKKD